MERDRMKKMLARVRSGDLGVPQAMELLRGDSLEPLAFANLDFRRAIRRGFPEVVYGPGKSDEQIVEIVRRLRAASQTVLVTRTGPEAHRKVLEVEPRAEFHEEARAIVVRQGRRTAGRPGIVVVTAGTADGPVGAEAALTAELMGNRVELVRDVGVAGIHRLAEHRETLLAARVLVVVAGMEGALPSVLGGLTDCPVIGVPTSTGYGIGGQGQAALLAMLNSCSAGLTVVNIDNGFGAGYAAGLINAARPPVSRKSKKPGRG